MTNKYKIKIDKIDIENNLFTITSSKNDIFNSTINKGSIDFRIYNESKKEVNLTNLEEGDNITIYGIPDTIKNNIIIIKRIKIKNRYEFINESSDENDF